MITHPLGAVSVWLAGTGEAAVPLAFLTSALTVNPKLVGAGQVLPAGGLVIARMWSR